MRYRGSAKDLLVEQTASTDEMGVSMSTLKLGSSLQLVADPKQREYTPLHSHFWQVLLEFSKKKPGMHSHFLVKWFQRYGYLHLMFQLVSLWSQEATFGSFEQRTIARSNFF